MDAWERRQVALDRLEARRQFVRALRVQLHAQQRARIVGLQNRAAHAIHRRILPRVIEDEAVHDFDRGRLVLQDGGRRGQRVEQLLELNQEHGLLASAAEPG